MTIPYVSLDFEVDVIVGDGYDVPGGKLDAGGKFIAVS
jgi:hypothetical protein